MPEIMAEATALPWREIDLEWLEPAIAPGPAFPTGALPNRMEAIVKSFAVELCVSPDFVAGAIIGAASAAIGNRARVLGYDGRLEPLTLFMALVGWPATGKGIALSIAEAALMRVEEALEKAHAEHGAAASAMVRAFGDSVKERLLHEGIGARVADNNSKLGAPAPRLLLSELTQPGILKELQGDAAGRFLLTDELTVPLACPAGQAGLKQRAFFLLAFDGKPYRKRIATDDLIYVPALQFGILGGTQPDRVSVIVSRARDGLAPRFLWLAPEVDPIATMPRGAGPIDEWVAALLRTVRIKPAADDRGYAHAIPLAERARAPLEAAGAPWAEAQKHADPAQRDFLSRARQQAVRLSGVIAQLERSLSGEDGPIAEIGAEDVERAVALMNTYFLPMAEHTFALAGLPGDSDAKRLARHFRRLGQPTIVVRDDVYRRAGSPTKTAATAGPAIVELMKRGFVREAPADPQAKGRPSVILEVHPDLILT
jgi:hypothetical protein